MIHAENLTKQFGRVRALDGITLDVPPASVFALVGPNGAGKSSAIGVFLNLIRPDGGHAEILGADSRRLDPARLARIGYVSETQRLPTWMSPAAFFAFLKPLYPAWDDTAAQTLAQEYGLPLDRAMNQLSRGMKVKAALVAALSYRPELLILDEPFSGLDVLVREQLIQSLLERAQESAILFASHDLSEIESFATHVAYLNEGRLEFTEETAALVGRFREVELTLESPTSAAPSPPAPPNWLDLRQSGPVVRFVDSHYDAARTRAEIAARFPAVRDAAFREMSFRSIFLALARSNKGEQPCA